jgi:glycosyltransferase involved in cell wall biosynthesis
VSTARAPELSVVIPIHNEASHLAETLEALVTAVQRSRFDTELVLVDDGSTDGSADAVREALAGRLALSVVSQPNRGRFEAVRAGLARAAAEDVLVLGSRVRLRPDSLAFVRDRRDAGEPVWVGHVHIDTAGNPYGRFQNVLTEIAWREYFDRPRTTSFGTDDFDHYPKGSGSLFGPRALLTEAFAEVPSRYADPRHANDDTPMLRRVVASERIHVSPSFASDYAPRGTFRRFVSHSLHRGTVFFDGHGRRESRFFPFVLAFFPLSAVLVLASVVRPRLVPISVAGMAAGAGAVAAAARRPRGDVGIVALLAPVWAGAFGAGLWRGLALAAAKRARAPKQATNGNGG